MISCLESAMRDRSDKWWSETKASDDFLDRLFDDYSSRSWACPIS